MFDRVVVISLARRPDRLEAFWGRLPADWPLPCPEVHVAVDGLESRPPSGWQTTPGAWGCALSHGQVIDSSLDAGVERLLVLEDDASFLPDFSARLAAVAIPGDCQQLYLGGQHLSKAEEVGPGILRGRNINRTHAYGVFGREAMETLRDWISPGPHWKVRHHVDHQMGVLHREKRIAVYAVRPWLCGQAENLSDITSKPHKARSW